MATSTARIRDMRETFLDSFFQAIKARGDIVIFHDG